MVKKTHTSAFFSVKFVIWENILKRNREYFQEILTPKIQPASLFMAYCGVILINTQNTVLTRLIRLYAVLDKYSIIFSLLSLWVNSVNKCTCCVARLPHCMSRDGQRIVFRSRNFSALSDVCCALGSRCPEIKLQNNPLNTWKYHNSGARIPRCHPALCSARRKVYIRAGPRHAAEK